MTSFETTHAKRMRCTRCQRAQSGCICQWIRTTASAAEVLILQHPMEVQHVKGSARLLSLSLINSRLAVGEAFESTNLQALLTAPWLTTPPALSPKQAILLYPELPQDAADPNAARIELTPEQLADPAQLRLVVIDGSWRKSRKMLYLNPLLQRLPRLQLDAAPVSRYRIRKAHRPDQLSTYEATCAALLQLEGENANFASLMAGFDGFVEQQIQAKPSPLNPCERIPKITTRENFRALHPF